MTTPTVTETLLTLARTERDDFADEDTPRRRHGENAEQAARRPRAPRSQPYHRASQREAVRASLDSELCAHTYNHRSES
jgi:hypothetical protein